MAPGWGSATGSPPAPGRARGRRDASTRTASTPGSTRSPPDSAGIEVAASGSTGPGTSSPGTATTSSATSPTRRQNGVSNRHLATLALVGAVRPAVHPRDRADRPLHRLRHHQRPDHRRARTSGSSRSPASRGPATSAAETQLFRANIRGGVTIGPNCRIGGEVEATDRPRLLQQVPRGVPRPRLRRRVGQPRRDHLQQRPAQRLRRGLRPAPGRPGGRPARPRSAASSATTPAPAWEHAQHGHGHRRDVQRPARGPAPAQARPVVHGRPLRPGRRRASRSSRCSPPPGSSWAGAARSSPRSRSSSTATSTSRPASSASAPSSGPTTAAPTSGRSPRRHGPDRDRGSCLSRPSAEGPVSVRSLFAASMNGRRWDSTRSTAAAARHSRSARGPGRPSGRPWPCWRSRVSPSGRPPCGSRDTGRRRTRCAPGCRARPARSCRWPGRTVTVLVVLEDPDSHFAVPASCEGCPEAGVVESGDRGRSHLGALGVVGPADLLEVQVGHRPVDRDHRMPGIVPRSQQPVLLAEKRQEDQTSRGA